MKLKRARKIKMKSRELNLHRRSYSRGSKISLLKRKSTRRLRVVKSKIRNGLKKFFKMEMRMMRMPMM